MSGTLYEESTEEFNKKKKKIIKEKLKQDKFDNKKRNNSWFEEIV